MGGLGNWGGVGWVGAGGEFLGGLGGGRGEGSVWGDGGDRLVCVGVGGGGGGAGVGKWKQMGLSGDGDRRG